MNIEKAAIAKIFKTQDQSLLKRVPKKVFTRKFNRMIISGLHGYVKKYGSVPKIDAFVEAIKPKIPVEDYDNIKAYLDGIDMEEAKEDEQFLVNTLKEHYSLKVIDDSIKELIMASQRRDFETASSIIGTMQKDMLIEDKMPKDITEETYEPKNIKLIDSCMPSMAQNNLMLGGVVLIGGGSGCVDRETEFLTPNGWKSIDTYSKGDKVLQWNKDGSTEFVEPLKYIKLPCTSMFHIKNKYVDLMFSEEHRVIYSTNKRGNYQVKEILMGDLYEKHNRTKQGFFGSFITNFEAPKTAGVPYTNDELRLLVAIQADGHFSKQAMKGQAKTCRVNLKKERKKERLENLLNRLNIKFKKTKSVTKGFHFYYFQAPNKNKTLTEFWEATEQQLKVIANECVYWDGYLDRGQPVYFSSLKEEADFMHYCFSVAYKTRASLKVQDRRGQPYKTAGKVYTRKSIEYAVRSTAFKTTSLKGSSNKSNVIMESKTTDGFKYCFTMPSSYWIMRRKGNILVTGNSGKSVLALQQLLYSYEQGLNCCLLNLELGYDETVARAYSTITNKPFGDIFGNPSPKVGKDIEDWKNSYFNRKNRFFINNVNYNTEEIVHTIEAMHKIGVTVFVLDYIQLVDYTNKAEEWKMIRDLVRTLHRLTQELGVTIITPVQINLADVKEKEGILKITVRGSKELEYSSTVFLFIYQTKEEYKEDMGRIFTIKARNAKKGTYVMQTKFDTMKFEDTGVVL